MAAFSSEQDSVKITPDYLVGAGLVYSAGVLWALYNVYAKKIQSAESSGSTGGSGISYRDIFVASMAYTFLLGLAGVLWFSPSLDAVALISASLPALYLAVFCSVIPFQLYLRSLAKTSVFIASIMLLTQVIVAFFISILFLGEPASIVQVIGIIIVTCSVAVVVVSPSSEKVVEETISSKKSDGTAEEY